MKNAILVVLAFHSYFENYLRMCFPNNEFLRIPLLVVRKIILVLSSADLPKLRGFGFPINCA